MKPKGITSYSKCPRWVLKAVLQLSTSLMCTKWYTFQKFSLVKMVAPCKSSKAKREGATVLVLHGNLVLISQYRDVMSHLSFQWIKAYTKWRMDERCPNGLADGFAIHLTEVSCWINSSCWADMWSSMALCFTSWASCWARECWVCWVQAFCHNLWADWTQKQDPGCQFRIYLQWSAGTIYSVYQKRQNPQSLYTIIR